MIEPTIDDIGRKVVYRRWRIGRHANGQFDLEEGIITSFNEAYVFVRYGADVHSKGTRREDLEWCTGG